jgi:hypothetical protein
LTDAVLAVAHVEEVDGFRERDEEMDDASDGGCR